MVSFKKCKTGKDVAAVIKTAVLKISEEDYIDFINTRFVYMEDAARAVRSGLVLGMNVFLHGPGGYGKSELIKATLDFYKLPFSTIVGYKDMPVDALLGIPNMKKLLEESDYEIYFEKSVFAKPVIIIFEEITDILPETVTVLKTIITEGGFRSKDRLIPSMAPIIISASNKSPNEIVDDESKRAFYMERFPIKHKVIWEAHEKEHYGKLLDLVFKDEREKTLHFMATLLADNANNYNNVVSPRISIDMTKGLIEGGVEILKNFDIDLDRLYEIEKEAEISFKTITLSDLFEKLHEFLDEKEDDCVSLLIYYLINEAVISGEAMELYEKLKLRLIREINGNTKGVNNDKLKAIIDEIETTFK